MGKYEVTVSFDYRHSYPYPKQLLGLKVVAKNGGSIIEYLLQAGVSRSFNVFNGLVNELTSTVTNNTRYFSTACIKYSILTFFQPVKETRGNEEIAAKILLKWLSDELTRLGPRDNKEQHTIDETIYRILKNFTSSEKKQLKEILADSDHNDRNIWRLRLSNISDSTISDSEQSTQQQTTPLSTY